MPETYATPDGRLLRCAFPRGRVLQHVEDDLTVLIQLVMKYGGMFEKIEFMKCIQRDVGNFYTLNDKSIKNRCTEMLTLFGLTVTSDDGIVQPSQRCALLSASQDFPMFFQSFCHKFQFPNCINAAKETQKQLEHDVQFAPAAFILQVLQKGAAKYGEEFSINAKEVSHLMFNDLDVTTGKKSPVQVLDLLMTLRRRGTRYEGGSRWVQHGREFLGYMQLAGLLTENMSQFSLHRAAQKSAQYQSMRKDFFTVPKEYLESKIMKKKTMLAWQEWYGAVSDEEKKHFAANTETLDDVLDDAELPTESESLEGRDESTTALGNIGECIVLKYEKDEMAKIRPDKVNIIRRVSGEPTLGYDIQSLETTDVRVRKLIEVKTTRRIFAPSAEIITYFGMSSNQWEAAEHYGEHYYIYRVFLLANEKKIYIVQNPAAKEKSNLILKEPLHYKVMLKKNSGYFVTMEPS